MLISLFHQKTRGDHGLHAVEESGILVLIIIIHDVLASNRCINVTFGIGLNGITVPAMSINAKYPVERRPLMKHSIPRYRTLSNFLELWKDMGMDTIALSAYHHDDKLNDEAFRSPARRRPLDWKIETFSEFFKVRLSFVMMKGYIDSVDAVKEALAFSRRHRVFQTTFREVGMPAVSRNDEVSAFVQGHVLDKEQSASIKKFFDENGHACDKLPFGGTIYDIDGQNACLTTCLDQCENNDDLRNLIFFPDGTLSTSWECPRGSAIF